MMRMIIKTPGLGVIMILVGVGSIIGALALTESQADVKDLFAVIADAKTNFFLLQYEIFHLSYTPLSPPILSFLTES